MSSTTTPQSPLTLTVLGCGTMGVAILSGILDSLTGLRVPGSPPASNSNNAPQILLNTAPSTGTLTPGGGTSTPALPARLPNRFIACVKRHESAVRVERALSRYGSCVQVYENDNERGVVEGDVILLCCKPQMCEEVLSPLCENLGGKLLVSILAGVTGARLKQLVPSTTRVMRVMPNTASKVRVLLGALLPNPLHLFCSFTYSLTRTSMLTILFPTLFQGLPATDRSVKA